MPLLVVLIAYHVLQLANASLVTTAAVLYQDPHHLKDVLAYHACNWQLLLWWYTSLQQQSCTHLSLDFKAAFVMPTGKPLTQRPHNNTKNNSQKGARTSFNWTYGLSTTTNHSRDTMVYPRSLHVPALKRSADLFKVGTCKDLEMKLPQQWHCGFTMPLRHAVIASLSWVLWVFVFIASEIYVSRVSLKCYVWRGIHISHFWCLHIVSLTTCCTYVARSFHFNMTTVIHCRH